MGTKRLVLIALLTSLALALQLIERSITIPILVPGVKLGLANVISLLAILLLGLKDAFLIVILRCLLGALFGGNPISFLFSITGGLLSTLFMSLLWKKFSKYISIINISLVGAVCHNIGQLVIASIIVKDLRIYVYLPVLLLSGLITGYITGVIASRSYAMLKSR